jgi:hypothetical protein
MKSKISELDFNFIPSGHGHYKVTYTSPVTKKSWTKLISDMQMIDNARRDFVKVKDLKILKYACKH